MADDNSESEDSNASSVSVSSGNRKKPACKKPSYKSEDKEDSDDEESEEEGSAVMGKMCTGTNAKRGRVSRKVSMDDDSRTGHLLPSFLLFYNPQSLFYTPGWLHWPLCFYCSSRKMNINEDANETSRQS